MKVVSDANVALAQSQNVFRTFLNTSCNTKDTWVSLRENMRVTTLLVWSKIGMAPVRPGPRSGPVRRRSGPVRPLAGPGHGWCRSGLDHGLARSTDGPDLPLAGPD